MSADYVVEPLSAETFAELAPLMQDAFGDTVESAFFNWKYLDNPAGPAIGNIARAGPGGEVAAFYGMIPEIYRWGSEVHRIYQSCDTMTHSRHRRRGLFRLLALETYQTAKAVYPHFFAYGFGGPTSTPGFLKMDWRIEFEISHLFRPFPLTMLPAWRGSVGKVRSLAAPTDELVEMIRASAAGQSNSIEKSEAFIRWRLGNPLRRYEYLVDDAGAYAIYYRAGGIQVLFDFWEREPGVGTAVWNALRRASLSPRTKGILTFAQRGTALEQRLKRYGFVRNPFNRGPGAGTIPFITFGECPGGWRAENWSITPFDHDSY
jgi:hypothetical protein